MKRKNILKYVLVAEVFIFILFYYQGAHGLRAVYNLQKENTVIEEKIKVANQELVQLEEELQTWQSEPFYKEKLAREQLHMARDGEEIYLT